MIRNGISLDYCFEEAIKSMLPICEQVVISDCESTDGTREFLEEWAKNEPKLKVVTYPWTDPRGDHAWFPAWINATRANLTTDYVTYTDGDECWHTDAYPIIRQFMDEDKVMMAYRYNFWRDAKHLIPVGHCLGVNVIRLAPNKPEWHLPSDYPTPQSAEVSRRAVYCKAGVMHYGFLRKREHFFKKARAVARIFDGGTFDPRLENAEKFEGNWMLADGLSPWTDALDDFRGKHPQVIIQWLRDRGYPIGDDGTPL